MRATSVVGRRAGLKATRTLGRHEDRRTRLPTVPTARGADERARSVDAGDRTGDGFRGAQAVVVERRPRWKGLRMTDRDGGADRTGRIAPGDVEGSTVQRRAAHQRLSTGAWARWVRACATHPWRVVFGWVSIVVVLLDEAITAGAIGGLLLILAGSWLGAEGRLPWQRRRAPAPAPDPPPAAVSRSEPSRSSAPAPARAR
jgi:hypothetical protein